MELVWLSEGGRRDSGNLWGVLGRDRADEMPMVIRHRLRRSRKDCRGNILVGI